MAERCPHYDTRQPQNAEGWVCQDCGAEFKADPWDRYYTSPKTVQAMLEVARLTQGMTVLEPSAGDGAIVRLLPLDLGLAVTAVEPVHENARVLRSIRPGLVVVEEDFLHWRPVTQFDVAVMNPPYSAQDGADGLHVMQALRCAQRVVALVRTNFLHGLTRYHQVFRWSRVLSITVLVRRPKFEGPAPKGDSARHDYSIVEFERRGAERQPGEADPAVVRFQA